MSNIWIDKSDLERHRTYIDFVEWFQNHLYWLYKCYEKWHRVFKACEVALKLNHNAFYNSSAQDHVEVAWDIIKKLKTFSADDKKLQTWCNKGFEKIDIYGREMKIGK